MPLKDLLQNKLTPQVDWVEFQADYAARTALSAIASKLDSITEQITDTRILHDNDNFQQSLTQYSYLSYLSQQNVADTTGLKEEVAQFFPRVGNNDKAPATPAL